MAASSPKTVPTGASVAAFLAGAGDAGRRADCDELVRLMSQATGEPACMWGPAIVGFGRYRQGDADGTSGEWPLIAFSPRKSDLTLYITPGFEGRDDLLARLGRHKTGKVCLYIKRLADVDREVLSDLIAGAVAAMADRRIPQKVHA